MKRAKSDDERIRALYEVVYQRRPDSAEVKLAHEFLQRAKPEPAGEVLPPVIWQYGYGEVDESSGKVKAFTALPYFNNYSWQGGKELPDPKLGWVLLSSEGGHPGKNPGFAAIRRWVVPRDGVVHFKGELQHPSEQGDGVRARLISSREGRAGEWIVQGSKTNTVIEKIKVKRGDTLDLVTDSRGNEGFDSFSWTGRFRYPGADAKKEDAPRRVWRSKDDFSGPQPAKTPSLGNWEKYAQALLLSNELFFVD